MHAPRKTIPRGGGKEFIFLPIVEILDVQPALVFAEGCDRQHAFAIHFEWPEIMLQAGDEGDMARGFSRRECRE